jgi:Putative Se/S carrier protein-like
MTVYAIITFHNTHFALKAKKVLEKSGRKPETIPVPREFSSECGFCCKVLWEEKDAVADILTGNSVAFDAVHRWERDDEMERKRKFRFV